MHSCTTLVPTATRVPELNVNVQLSNCEVRAYKRERGNLAFHLKTALLTDIGWDFPVSHVDTLRVSMVLPDGEAVDFQPRMHVDSAYMFDGEVNAVTLDLSSVSQLTDVDSCVVRLVVDCRFDFGGAMPHVVHEQWGLLRRMF
jgi:hypothetical protein